MSMTLSGNGTITGLVSGGLPDGTVLPADLSTGGPYWDTSGNLGVGTTSADRRLTIDGGLGTGDIRIKTGGALRLNNPANNAAMAMYLNSSNVFSLNDQLYLDSSGNLLVGKTSATANGGDIQVSKGITFPATQVACSDPNTLDDYEEGVFTPVVDFDGVAVTSYTTQTGKYVKIGKMVTVTGRVVVNVKGSGTGLARIYGLPFSADNFGGNPSYAGSITAVSGFANVTGCLTGWIENTVYIPYVNNNGTGTFTFGGNWANGCGLTFTATYYTP